jgi:hypothetical protein
VEPPTRAGYSFLIAGLTCAAVVLGVFGLIFLLSGREAAKEKAVAQANPVPSRPAIKVKPKAIVAPLPKPTLAPAAPKAEPSERVNKEPLPPPAPHGPAPQAATSDRAAAEPPAPLSPEGDWAEVNTSRITAGIVAAAPNGVRFLDGVLQLKFTEPLGGPLQADPIFDAPGSLWFIAQGGVTWNGADLREGEIYRIDDARVPRRVRKTEYALWVVLKQQRTLHRDPGGEVLPHALDPGEKVRLLSYASGPKGWDKVRTAGVKAVEGWVQEGRIDKLFFLKARRPAAAQDPAPERPTPKPFEVVSLLPAQGDLPTLLAREAARARERGLKPCVEFTAAWCQPSRALHRSLDDPRMADAFRGVCLIRLDVDDWRDRLPGTGFAVRAVPLFAELDGQGRPTGRTIDGSAWGADTPANMAPPLKRFFHGP